MRRTCADLLVPTARQGGQPRPSQHPRPVHSRARAHHCRDPQFRSVSAEGRAGGGVGGQPLGQWPPPHVRASFATPRACARPTIRVPQAAGHHSEPVILMICFSYLTPPSARGSVPTLRIAFQESGSGRIWFLMKGTPEDNPRQNYWTSV